MIPSNSLGKALCIVLIGPPASGKGTIAKWIQRDIPNLQVFSTGAILQRLAQQDNSEGEYMRRFLASGNLMDDQEITEILFRELPMSGGWILDGYPRTRNQAEILHQRLAQRNMNLDAAIILEVPAETIRERIMDRWVHPGSGRSYSYAFNPPKQSGIDDISGEPLQRRLDDRAELFDKRFSKYAGHIEEIKEFYRNEGVGLVVKGLDSKSIYEQVFSLLRDKFAQFA